jgi:hypothetical protein
MRSAKIRAIASTGPPAAAGTIKFMARDGKPSAWAPAENAAMAINVVTSSFFMSSQSMEDGPRIAIEPKLNKYFLVLRVKIAGELLASHVRF